MDIKLIKSICYNAYLAGIDEANLGSPTLATFEEWWQREKPTPQPSGTGGVFSEHSLCLTPNVCREQKAELTRLREAVQIADFALYRASFIDVDDSDYIKCISAHQIVKQALKGGDGKCDK